MSPTKIGIKDKQYLVINWSDNSATQIKLSNLRKKCPCAVCVSEKEKHGKKYIPIYSLDETTISQIDMVGNYAVNIIWKDGHNTGIYEFDQLLNISSTIDN